MSHSCVGQFMLETILPCQTPHDSVLADAGQMRVRPVDLQHLSVVLLNVILRTRRLDQKGLPAAPTEAGILPASALHDGTGKATPVTGGPSFAEPTDTFPLRLHIFDGRGHDLDPTHTGAATWNPKQHRG